MRNHVAKNLREQCVEDNHGKALADGEIVCLSLNFMANISHTRYNELIRKEKELQYLQEGESIREFCKEFSISLGTLAAHTPYEKWPSQFKEAFKWVERKAPTAAWIYKQRLPK